MKIIIVLNVSFHIQLTEFLISMVIDAIFLTGIHSGKESSPIMVRGLSVRLRKTDLVLVVEAAFGLAICHQVVGLGPIKHISQNLVWPD
jgi:hypothetical protein